MIDVHGHHNRLANDLEPSDDAVDSCLRNLVISSFPPPSLIVVKFFISQAKRGLATTNTKLCCICCFLICKMNYEREKYIDKLSSHLTLLLLFSLDCHHCVSSYLIKLLLIIIINLFISSGGQVSPSVRTSVSRALTRLIGTT